ncbi:MAG: hypothetical protein DRR00_24455 [Candidatus Parabeggiatoa sp. nov. 3]|nr:MAG: hypothetical protein DRR00_24455 [Gammaproteobacteria bacterium]
MRNQFGTKNSKSIWNEKRKINLQRQSNLYFIQSGNAIVHRIRGLIGLVIWTIYIQRVFVDCTASHRTHQNTPQAL